MNYLFKINKDLLIHHIFIYLNSYDIMNIKKACNKYFYLIISSYHLEVVGRLSSFKRQFELMIKKDKITIWCIYR